MAKEKEREYFSLVTNISADLYVRYRRLSEFQSALSIARDRFTEEVNENLLNQDKATQHVYLERIYKMFNAIDLNTYIDYGNAYDILHKHRFEWGELNAFYRTMHDFYILNINAEGVIGYYNKEPDIPTDYDVPEMGFLQKGSGFLTDEDARQSKEYDDKYGKYTYDVWDIFHKDILPQQRFLELLPQIYQASLSLKTNFPTEVTGEPVGTLLQLKFYVFNSLQKNSLLETKTFINQTRRSFMKQQGTASFDNFDVFIKAFEFNYPYKDAVMYSIYRWRTNLEYLQKEILDNLILLEGPARTAYLKRVRFDCEALFKNAHTPLDGLDPWLQKYDTSLSEAIDEHPFIKTALNDILSNEPETFRESMEPDADPSGSIIRMNFYNYFYGHYLEKALEFISEQEQPASQESSQPERPKLRIKFTVPQLAYFFKLMIDGGYFYFKHKTEVYKFIASNFETERAKNISADSIKNQMDGPELKSIEKIHEAVMQMLQTIKKDKKNLGA